MGLPTAHVQDGCIVQKLCWNAIQPVSFFLLRDILQHFPSYYKQTLGGMLRGAIKCSKSDTQRECPGAVLA